jgi:hypothetical protein
LGNPAWKFKNLFNVVHFGVQSLSEYLELLVEEGSVVEGLVKGKVSAMISVIDE